MQNCQTELRYDAADIFTQARDNLSEIYKAFEQNTDIVSRQRCDIARRCEAFAGHPVKTCKLVVPTGGGKTLSSFRFALRHCLEYGKKKIIYTAPFMSILEQNSDEIKAFVGDEWLTEHHSNIWAELEDDEVLHEYELRTEKWDSPVITTTMVQMLNTFFLDKGSSVRRFHRLCDSILIIDEIQSIPVKCVHLFNLAVNFLSQMCGTVIVLCSATQPAIENVDHPIILDADWSMTGDTDKDFDVFHRTDVISKVTPYGMSNIEAAEFAAEKFKEYGNLLMVVNTKTSAKNLYRLLKERCANAEVVHLSTNMCPQHRRDSLRNILAALKAGKPIICVTTQLIEAGVNVSFRCVIRSLAGLDNAAQAAGRCNRNGESPIPCPVYLIKLREENVAKLDGMESAQRISERIISSKQYPDLLSSQTQSVYSAVLYTEMKKELSYRVKVDGMDTNLVDLLSLNHDNFSMSGLPKERQFSVQAFKTAGSNFEVISSQTRDIIVPYDDDAKSVIASLDTPWAFASDKNIKKKAQRYTVSIFEWQYKKLSDCGAIRALCSGAAALEDGFYNKEYGIDIDAEQKVLIL